MNFEWWGEGANLKAEVAVPNTKPFGKSVLCICECDGHIWISNSAVNANAIKTPLMAKVGSDEEWVREREQERTIFSLIEKKNVR